MSNLMSTAEGRNAVLVAQKYLLERRLARHFKRNAIEDFKNWQATGNTSLATVVGYLNDANDPELLDLYRLLGVLGGLQESVSDVTIYVDGTLGSDTTGDGSDGNPYKSLWFLDNLPRRISHAYRVVIRNSVSYYDKVCVLDFTITGNGFFTFVGQGAPVNTGSVYTVDTADNFASLSASFARLTDAPVDASFRGHFVIGRSGAEENRVIPTGWSSPVDSTIYSEYSGLNGYNTGDTLQPVIPVPEIIFPMGVVISCAQAISRPDTGSPTASLTFCNLTIDTGDTATYSMRIISDSVVVFSFCIVIIRSQAIFSRGNINEYSSSDTQLSEFSQTGIVSLFATWNGVVFRDETGEFVSNQRITILRGGFSLSHFVSMFKIGADSAILKIRYGMLFCLISDYSTIELDYTSALGSTASRALDFRRSDIFLLGISSFFASRGLYCEGKFIQLSFVYSAFDSGHYTASQPYYLLDIGHSITKVNVTTNVGSGSSGDWNNTLQSTNGSFPASVGDYLSDGKGNEFLRIGL